MSAKPRLRCAIYTRKSSEEGLEQDFNSLEAQREACEAYIKSQAHEGWTLVRDHFDDGGFSGGNMERPALKGLMQRVDAAEIDIIVVYKIDRLTRSLTDFARLAETFDAHKVSFVSVTQQFNTTSSMGRLMLNVLLSFAQFEREITGERIRDKIAASKKKGMWMGGVPPIGYDISDRKLVVNADQAKIVQSIFSLYLDARTVPELMDRLMAEKIKTAPRTSSRGSEYGGRPFTRGHLYKLLSNPIYIGRIPHGKTSYPGQHEAIIDQSTWEAVQAQLSANTQGQSRRKSQRAEWMLDGLLYAASGARLVPSHATKGGRRYRYYIEPGTSADQNPVRLPAREIEAAAIAGLGSFLNDEQKLLSAVGSLAPAETRSVLASARKLATELQDISAQKLSSVLGSIVYNDRHLELHVVPAGLVPTGKAVIQNGVATEAITRVPLAHHRRGRQLKMTVPGSELNPLPDASLVHAIARSWDWFRRLSSGEVSSLAEVCRNEGFSDTYVGQVLRLAFLAPTLVESILDGRQPPALNAEKLIWETPLPPGWINQIEVLN